MCRRKLKLVFTDSMEKFYLKVVKGLCLHRLLSQLRHFQEVLVSERSCFAKRSVPEKSECHQISQPKKNILKMSIF